MEGDEGVRLSKNQPRWQMDVIFDLNTAPSFMRPAELVAAWGIEFREWDPQPIADRIILRSVNPDTVPRPLPAYLQVKVHQLIEHEKLESLATDKRQVSDSPNEKARTEPG